MSSKRTPLPSRVSEPNSTFRSPETTFAPTRSPAPGGMMTQRVGHVTFQEEEADDGEDVATAIPSVNERLGHLRPSRELLEYYRKKIAEFDGEHEDMLNRLEQYKMTYEQQHKLEWELRQREEEIVELQKALSDMQVYLFQERDHVLRLFAENDRLKIQELEDRKRIQHLLSLSSPAGPEVTYFHKEPPSKAIVTQKHLQKRYPHAEGEKVGLKAEVLIRPQSNRTRREAQDRVAAKTKGKQRPASGQQKAVQSEGGGHQEDREILLLQIEALQSQMKEQAELSREQTEALLEDRRVRIEEMQTVIERDCSKIQSLNEKLHRTQQMLYDSTKDYLELKYEGRSQERGWMAEKDQLLQELDHCKEQLDVSKDDVLVISDHALEERQTQSLEIESLENQLQQAQKLADMYREQVIGLEDELARIRERDDVSKDAYKDKMVKLAKRLQLMNQRYDALEKRRNLEIEGFKNDTRILRTRLKDVEKQLYKMTVGVGEEGDMLMLHDIHQTARRSKKMQGELHQLKAFIYGMENDLRNL
ncbi:coiled-coil domain-containing protein 77-like isoform X2 [Acanthaster planci]|uniref:Coiled-coil domain-containing protein 77-like isoform X2 n=1 Tax=Acanthaster planci TaxID=133434 RepID=A0A8B7XP79_ACAPL|nr:coiled-coil domain-containing protein 77-like isoform X2 [Acanthaster planci]